VGWADVHVILEKQTNKQTNNKNNKTSKTREKG
jgi:hypothetical protein